MDYWGKGAEGKGEGRESMRDPGKRTEEEA